MLKNFPHLVQRNARKPLNEVLNRSVVLKILKKGGNWNPRAAEYPRSTHASGVTLNGGAG